MTVLTVLLVALPLAGCLGVLVFPERWAVRAGIVVTSLTLLDAITMLAVFDYGAAARMQLSVNWPWVPAIGLRLHLGVDGVSLPLVALTALLTLLCLIYEPQPARPRRLVALLLLLEVGLLATFVALDLLLFFVAFETVLIPMYVVIAGWGGPGRRSAANKFILYTLLGSGVMLVGLLLIYAQTGTLDMVNLAESHGAGLTRGAQIVAFVAVAGGLAVKVPMWPLHTWLPDAHTEAPTIGSVLLAGVLLKMGTYGLIRIAVPILPEGAATLAPVLGAFAVIGIVYAALVCLALHDVKRLVAFSSVGHMGFVLLGIATLTPVGINAALFANVAHGLITGLLFFLVGGVKRRYGTMNLERIGGGMLTTAPHLASLLTVAAVASFGLPGLAGFWGEMLALLGAYRPAPDLPRGLFLGFMAVSGIGAVLAAAYFLRMLSHITHGLVPPAWLARAPLRDVTTTEYAAWAPLVVAIFMLGLWPGLLLGMTNPAARALIGGG